MLLRLLLLLCGGAAMLAVGSVVPVTDSNLVFSRFNWVIGGGAAAASNPGASLKFGFTNSTAVALRLDTSNSTTPACTLVLYSVDDGPWAFATPPPGSPNATVPLAADLAIDAAHDVRAYLYASCSQRDRWLQTPAAAGGNAFLVVTGVVLDDSGAATPPPLVHAATALVFGDSITEGSNGHNYDWDSGACGGRLGLGNSAAVDTWAFAAAEALQAEPSLAAFAAQGYATRNSYNYGNVPPLMTPGDAAATAWNQIRAGASRLAALGATPPTYIFNAMGFNDQNADVMPPALTVAVTAWLAAARAAVGANTSIFVVVPFGGEMRTANVTRLAIVAGYTAYMASSAGAADACSFLLDLYPRAQRGLQGFGRSTFESCEGTHPLAARHGQLGAMVAVEATRLLLAAAPACFTTVTPLPRT